MVEAKQDTWLFHPEWIKQQNLIKVNEEKNAKFDEQIAVFDDKFQRADEILNELREEISKSIFSDTNPEGILTAHFKDYCRCIELNKQALNKLFAVDKAFWKSADDKIRQTVSDAESKCSESLTLCSKALCKLTDSSKQGIQSPQTLKGVKGEFIQYSKSVQSGFYDILEKLPQQEIDIAKERCTQTDLLVYNLQGLIKVAEDATSELKEALE